MTQQDYSPQTERHLQLWLYFLPVVGVIPALWTLYRTQTQTAIAPEVREQQKVCRQSISLLLVWLTAYVVLSFGADGAAEMTNFRLLYTNAIATTAYFVTCTYLMSRLGRDRHL